MCVYSDYFKSMLLMGWRETSDGSTSLSLPFPSNLLSTVVAFIYTDNAPSVTSELVCVCVCVCVCV